nr:hypothetical protein [Tanacetum cinerariifolium]
MFFNFLESTTLENEGPSNPEIPSSHFNEPHFSNPESSFDFRSNEYNIEDVVNENPQNKIHKWQKFMSFKPDIPDTPVCKAKPNISKQYSQQSEVQNGKIFDNKESLILAVRLKAVSEDSYVPQLSTPGAYDRCCAFKGSIQGNKSGGCGHGWKQSDCANSIWYMQRGNRHAAIALAVEKEFPLAFHVVCCRHLMMNLGLKNKKRKANMTYEITDWAANKVAKKRMKSATWVVNGVNAYQYEVSDGLPTGHVIAITRCLGLANCVHYAADWFKKPKYQATYSESIYSFGNMHQWEFPENILKAIPPRMDNLQPRRLKNTNRIQSQGEEPRIIRCTRCTQTGHRRDQCSQPFVVQPPVNIRTHND